MEELIELLTQIENSNLKAKEILSDDDCPSVIRIRALLEKLLITSEGDINWDNRNKIVDAGWYIYPYEQDRFGWLLGAVVTKKGDIVFG